MQKKLLTLILFSQLLIAPKLFAQNIGINTTGALPDTSAMLDISSTRMGFLMPRMSNTERDAIVLPAKGLQIFNKSANACQVNTGTPTVPIWSTLTTDAGANPYGDGWYTIGNNGTNSAQNFIGTIDNHPLKFKVDNTLAGFIDSAGGGGNVFLGYQAGLNTDAFQGGVQNVFIGENAGMSNVFDSTHGGYGLGSVAVGYNALTSSHAGGNVAVGAYAAASNTSGIIDAYGYTTGYFNTTGIYNLFIGNSCGFFSTKGNYNVFTGPYAGFYNDSGSSNLYMGYEAGMSNVKGNYNTFLGTVAGYNSLSDYSTMIGYRAGVTNKNGKYNTILGYNADVASDSLTNGIAIGANARVSASNSLVLGGTGVSAVKVGIGNTAPNSTLQVSGSIAAAIAEITTSKTLDSTYHFVNVNSASATTITLPAVTNVTGREYIIRNVNSGSVTITVSGGGNIRTGSSASASVYLTTGQSYTFVAGNTYWEAVTPVASSQSGWATNGNSGTNSGNNFIGTTDNHPLKFKVNNTLAGFIDSAGGGGNIFLGYQAGLNTNALLGGAGNVFIGESAGMANVFDSTYGGYSAGSVAVGYNALMSSRAGSNVAVGAYAAASNTTGITDAYGYGAGYSNTTGTYNLFIGNNAGVSNTNGNYNVFTGPYAGYYNNNGSNNLCMGYQAGFSNVSGGYNTFLGTYAGYGSLSNYSTMIGYRAGFTNTNGIRNTLIGYNADVASNNLTNATAIGNDARVGASNSMVLGGTGGEAVKVGIGTTIPNSTLQVQGSIAAAVNEVTASVVLDSSYHFVNVNAASATTITLPAVTNLTGREYIIRNVNSGTVTISISGGGSLRVGSTTATSVTLSAAGQSYTITAGATYWEVMTPLSTPVMLLTAKTQTLTAPAAGSAVNVGFTAPSPNTITGGSFNTANNQITLPAGTYSMVWNYNGTVTVASAGMVACFWDVPGAVRMPYSSYTSSSGANFGTTQTFFTILTGSTTFNFSIGTATGTAATSYSFGTNSRLAIMKVN